MWRGTRAGLLAAARRFLPEGAGLYYEEFADGDPYHFRVFTFNTEPEVEAQIREALDHAKPAGLFPFTYEVRVGQTYHMLNARKPDYAETMSTMRAIGRSCTTTRSCPHRYPNRSHER